MRSPLPRPRQVHPNSVHICAVAVEYETKSGRVNKGVATSWLRAKEPAGENGRRALVPMFVRKSQFRLPFKATTPVILVGPGTGVAPFIGFIQERAWLRQQGEHVGPGRGPAGVRRASPPPLAQHGLTPAPPPGKEVGETLLYYGCRRSDEDYLYREELAGFHQDGSLTQLNVAVSREQPHKVRPQAAPRGRGAGTPGRGGGASSQCPPPPQVYVQHLLKRDKEHLWQLIHEGGAHIYVCG